MLRFGTRRAVPLGLTVLLATCVSVSKSVLIDRSAMPVPQEEVYVFVATDEIPESCERVAILHASGDQDLTDEGEMLDKLREEAGKLGANAIALWCPNGPEGSSP